MIRLLEYGYAWLACLACLLPGIAQALVLMPTDSVTDGVRELSTLETFAVTQPDGAPDETRNFKYSTPTDFASKDDETVNLWLVFHGGGGNTDTMHRYFDVISDTAPTVLVFPEALGVGLNGKRIWRGVGPGWDATDPEGYRDVIFVEQLVTDLLNDNPQLNPRKVYASGFSSGGNMTWMLLCYRSKLFQGFAIFSKQLSSFKRDGGCGDGRIMDSDGNFTIHTGYEDLTGGRQPDRYGSNPNLPPGKRANKTEVVFYSHGTYDDNLVYSGTAGCSELPDTDPLRCDVEEDPNNVMDSSNPGRDDIATKNWLLGRHDLLDSTLARVLPDQEPGVRDDLVVTTSRTYASSLGTSGVTSRKRVRWFEMDQGVHAMSALDHEGDECPIYPPPGMPIGCNLNDHASKDYETSIAVQMFFEQYGRMLR